MSADGRRADSALALREAVAGLFPADVLVAAAPIDDEAVFAFQEEEALVARAVDRRRREFATGRRLAHALLDELGVVHGPLMAERRAPVWPAGVVGSISHSRERCVAVVARDDAYLGIGVDHEPAAPLKHKLWRMILRPEEKARIEQEPEADRGLLAKLVFSAKECLYKAISRQLGEVIGFLEVELRLNRETQRFAATIVDPERAARVSGALEGRYLVRDEGVFTAMVLRARGRRAEDSISA